MKKDKKIGTYLFQTEEFLQKGEVRRNKIGGGKMENKGGDRKKTILGDNFLIRGREKEKFWQAGGNYILKPGHFHFCGK